MPEAAGAVAAGAVADRLLGPRERRQLAIILVVDLCHGMLTHVLYMCNRMRLFCCVS